MAKKNIPAIYKYGIQIVKPWSKEMYEFNDSLTEIMRKEIEFSINALEDEETANKLAKIINPYGYGQGYDLENMKQDMLKNVSGFENYWYAEIWDELITADFVQPIFDEEGNAYNIIGFESADEIKKLREIFA
jgi:hypothetical protein